MLDVRNTFNSARRIDIVGRAAKYFPQSYLLQLIEDYLNSRLLVYNTKEGTRMVDVTSGAA